MSKTVYPYFSQFVPSQFPQVFVEDGPQLIEFIKKFYEWSEAQGPDSKARNLLRYMDIDDTDSSLISHFVNKYMNGLPVERLGDKRFLQKHVLDIYRSKGSAEGLRLLFRFLYGEEIDIYIPSKDMIKSSDGIWVTPYYLEVSRFSGNADFFLKLITGATSGATAIVEDYVELNIAGRAAHVFFLSNISGNFTLYERLTYAGGPTNGPTIRGSLDSLSILSAPSKRNIGDPFDAVISPGYGAKARVNGLNLIGSGKASFSLINGGDGYRNMDNAEVLAGSLLTEAGENMQTEISEYIDFLPGSGASALVQVDITSYISYSTTIIGPYEPDTFVDATFLYNQTMITEDLYSMETEDGYWLLTDASVTVTINDNVLMSDWENDVSVGVGPIVFVEGLSDGSGYVDDLSVIMVDPLIGELLLSDGMGGYLGLDAVINGSVFFEANTPTSVRVYDSGFGYSSGDVLTLYPSDTLYSLDDTIPTSNATTNSAILATATLAAVGRKAGSWTGTYGMTNSDKYIQDSFYYQEFSYDVVSSRSLTEYERIVKGVVHPTGTELFGTAVTGGLVDDSYTSVSEVTQS